MLAVGIDLDGDVVAVVPGVLVARLYGSADAEVEGQLQHDRAGLAGHLRGGVARAVVDHSDVDVGALALDRTDHISHRAGLVERGDDREAALRHD